MSLLAQRCSRATQVIERIRNSKTPLGADSTDTRIAAQLSPEDLKAAKIVEKRQNDLKKKAQEAEDAKTKKF